MPKSCRYYINISRSKESAFERLNEVKSKARRFFLRQSEFHQTKWTGRSDIVLFAYFQPNVNLINYCVQVDQFRASDSISLSKSELAIFTQIYMQNEFCPHYEAANMVSLEFALGYLMKSIFVILMPKTIKAGQLSIWLVDECCCIVGEHFS